MVFKVKMEELSKNNSLTVSLNYSNTTLVSSVVLNIKIVIVAVNPQNYFMGSIFIITMSI